MGWSALAYHMEKLMTKTRKEGSHEPATLSDLDIVSNTKSTRASTCSNELRNADLDIVTGGRVNTPIAKIPGGTFPLGRVYVPTINIKTK
jgi:hypothetical protein